MQRLLILVFLVFCINALAAIEVADDTGHAVRLAEPARRIVALAPHVTEMLYAIGAGDRILATVEYSDYPPAAKSLPRVGGYVRIDLERLLSYRPDLVVAWTGNGQRLLERLRALGLVLYVTDPHRLEDIPVAMERLGRLTGTRARARDAANRFRERVRQLAEQHRGVRQVRVFYEIWHRPLRTTGGGTFIDQVIRLCGGRNVFDDLKAPAPVVSMEAVLARDPDVILINATPQAGEWKTEWERTGLPAARAGHLFIMPPDVLQRPGPRLAEGAVTLCRMLDVVRETAAQPRASAR